MQHSDITDIAHVNLHRFVVNIFLENVRFYLVFSFLLFNDLIATCYYLFTAKEWTLTTAHLGEPHNILCDYVIVLSTL